MKNTPAPILAAREAHTEQSPRTPAQILKILPPGGSKSLKGGPNDAQKVVLSAE